MLVRACCQRRKAALSVGPAANAPKGATAGVPSSFLTGAGMAWAIHAPKGAERSANPCDTEVPPRRTRGFRVVLKLVAALSPAKLLGAAFPAVFAD